MDIFTLLVGLWSHIPKKRKKQSVMLITLSILVSLTEIISIGSILPFLAALLNPEKIFSNQHAQFFIEKIGIRSSTELLLPLTISFVIIAIIAGGLRILLIWSTTNLSFAIGADLGYAMYKNTLYQEYSVHKEKNSSQLIDAIQNKNSTVIYLVLMPALNLMSTFILMLMVVAVLFFINPFISLIIFVTFGSIYGIVIVSARQRLINYSQQISIKSVEILKTLQEGFGSIRDILLNANQSFYLRIFQKADLQLRKAQASSTYIGVFPRNIMEILGIATLSVFAYFVSKSTNGIAEAIPLLGVAALGAQRLLPVLQQAYNAWTNIKVGKDSLVRVLEMLEEPISLTTKVSVEMPIINFENKIELKNICFRYDDESPLILNGVNLEIPKGSRLGIMGKTGGGKSTFLDILMGLLHPVNGSLSVDRMVIDKYNKASWQKRIAHVPQSIFLTDGSIAENIAFGVPSEKIDYRRIHEVVSQAQLLTFVNGLEKKLETRVGERGVKLSGGQKQRIGIARALYKSADIFIFDEATSALDSSTELAVMDSIKSFGPNLTILIISHRLSTLEICDEIYELDKGRLFKYHKDS